MQLKEIILNLNYINLLGEPNQEITGIVQDSRLVAPGNLFLCIKGSNFDGHRFLKEAAAKGASTALVEDLPTEDYGLTIIQVPQITSMVIKKVAGAFYNYPDRHLKLIGIIGTNGKTTSTYLMKSVLEAAGYQVGLVGTIANLVNNQKLATNNTTPGVLELQQIFRQMVDTGVEYVVMEVSSHSIHQERIAGLDFIGGIFTNITQDHLDYHKTFAEYLRVKTQFFLNLSETARAAINIDDPQAESIINQTKAQVWSYGINKSAEITAQKIESTPAGVTYKAQTPQGNIFLKLAMTGFFNVYNSLGIIAAGLSLGISLATIKKGLENVAGVPGRFQLVPESSSFGVVVDYAHTPDGLENILKTGRELTKKRLLLLFGCGGDRDRTKRGIMGSLAAKYADFSVITSDNPRSEAPGQIMQEILAGFLAADAAGKYLMEVDRRQAIFKIIAAAEPGDLVLIAGKGHEDYQIIGAQKLHFDDLDVAREALREYL